MGADGGITLFDFDAIVGEFGEYTAQTLIGVLPSTYVDELRGTRWLRCYSGDGSWGHWDITEDWSLSWIDVEDLITLLGRAPRYVKKTGRLHASDASLATRRVREIVDWAKEHAQETFWEVWT